MYDLFVSKTKIKKKKQKKKLEELEYPSVPVFSTRFQGSKKRVLDWLLYNVNKEMEIRSKNVFDAFSGTGVVGYGFAKKEASVSACDQLQSANLSIAAFIGNKSELSIDTVLKEIDDLRPKQYNKGLLKPYKGIFFPDDELDYLEKASWYARERLKGDDQAAFFWCLFQSAIAKRPYNLFHRNNLSMRTKDVKRSFGNKKTWDTSFPIHIKKFYAEHQKYALPNSKLTKNICGDVLEISKVPCDIVYIDSPYIDAKGKSTQYFDYYGFLEILVDPELTHSLNRSKAHRPLNRKSISKWERKSSIENAFDTLFQKYADKNIVVSYRDNGFPEIDNLVKNLKKYQDKVVVKDYPIQYALSAAKGNEKLLIGTHK